MTDEVYYLFIAVVVIILFIAIIYAIRIGTSKPLGSTCNVSSDCNAGLVCDGTLKVCKNPVGTVCVNDSDCTNNASCVGGVCKVKTIPPTITPTTVTPTTTQTTITPIIVSYDCDDTSCSSDTRSLSYPDTLSLSDSISSSSTKDCTTQTSTKDCISSSSTKDCTTQTCKLPSLSSLITGISSQKSSAMDQILDIVIYNGSEVILYKSGTITYNDRNYKSKIALFRLEVFNSKLYAISSEGLVRVNSPCDNNWELIIEDADIKHTSATRDGQYLWVQTRYEGKLLDRQLRSVLTIDCQGFVRNYGKTRDQYIDCYKENIVIHQNGETITKEMPYGVFNADCSSVDCCDREQWLYYKDIRNGRLIAK